MSLQPKNLYATHGLSNSVLLVAGPSSTGQDSWLIKNAVLSNTDSAGRSVELYRVASGDTPAAGNSVVPGKTIAAKESMSLDELDFMVLGPGDAIYGFADAAGVVNITLNGFVFQ